MNWYLRCGICLTRWPMFCGCWLVWKIKYFVMWIEQAYLQHHLIALSRIFPMLTGTATLPSRGWRKGFIFTPKEEVKPSTALPDEVKYIWMTPFDCACILASYGQSHQWKHTNCVLKPMQHWRSESEKCQLYNSSFVRNWGLVSSVDHRLRNDTLPAKLMC